MNRTEGLELLIVMNVAITTSAIFYMLNTAYVVEDMSFFVKGAGTFLYVAFLLLLLRYMALRTTSTLAGLLLLFVANGFFDYTAQVWMIVAVIPIVLFGKPSNSGAK